MAWCEVEWQGLLHTGQDRIEQRARSIGHGGWSHHTHMHIYCTVQGQGVCFGYFSFVVKPYMNIYGLMFACGIPFQVGYLGMQCNAMQRNFLKGSHSDRTWVMVNVVKTRVPHTIYRPIDLYRTMMDALVVYRELTPMSPRGSRDLRVAIRPSTKAPLYLREQKQSVNIRFMQFQNQRRKDWCHLNTRSDRRTFKLHLTRSSVCTVSVILLRVSDKLSEHIKGARLHVTFFLHHVQGLRSLCRVI